MKKLSSLFTLFVLGLSLVGLMQNVSPVSATRIREEYESKSVEVVENCDGSASVTVHGGDTRRTWRVEGVEAWIDYNQTHTFSASGINVVIEWWHENSEAWKVADETYVTRTKASDCQVPDELGYWMDDPGCGNSFGVNAKYVRNGVPVKDLKVEFKYMADHSYQTTNSDGVAEAGFEYKGNEKAYAIAEGFPQQELTPWLKTDCKPSETTGTVLGASTQGQVLGASTMAKTGSADQALALVFTLGSLLTTIGLKPYASKKN